MLFLPDRLGRPRPSVTAVRAYPHLSPDGVPGFHSNRSGRQAVWLGRRRQQSGCCRWRISAGAWHSVGRQMAVIALRPKPAGAPDENEPRSMHDDGSG
jgi:hypothetical protein